MQGQQFGSWLRADPVVMRCSQSRPDWYANQSQGKVAPGWTSSNRGEENLRKVTESRLEAETDGRLGENLRILSHSNFVKDQVENLNMVDKRRVVTGKDELRTTQMKEISTFEKEKGVGKKGVGLRPG